MTVARNDDDGVLDVARQGQGEPARERVHGAAVGLPRGPGRVLTGGEQGVALKADASSVVCRRDVGADDGGNETDDDRGQSDE